MGTYHILTYCSAHSLFAMPQCDDHLHDEALVTRIAALNLLDLELVHLGVIVDDPDEVVQINEVVRLSGVELQRMNGLKGPGEKLAILVNCHRIVVGKSWWMGLW